MYGEAWKDPGGDDEIDENLFRVSAKSYGNICKIYLEEFMKTGFDRQESMLLISVIIPRGIATPEP